MKKTILFLSANPSSTSRLRLDEEMREIQDGLRRGEHRDSFDLQSRVAVRPRDIRRALLDTAPSIIHFSGHGSGEEGLVFEDETGNAQLVNTDALSSLFELFADQIECLVLNACYSEVQAEAIVEHIPFVIGMNAAIGDRAAIEFSTSFYDAIVAGKPIDFAYKLGRSAIQMAGVQGHLIPVLKSKESQLTDVFQSYTHTEKSSLDFLPSSLSPSERFIALLADYSMGTDIYENLPSNTQDNLRSIQLAALRLLLTDQLDNGGWGKTFLYRRQAETLPVRLCTFGGTSLAVEALSIATRAEVPRINILKKLIDPLLSDDGIYYQTQRKANIGYEPQAENLRHISGAFLLKSSYLEIKPRDQKTIEYLIQKAFDLKAVERDYDSPDLELLDLSMLLKALLNSSYLIKDDVLFSHQAAPKLQAAYYGILARLLRRMKLDRQKTGVTGGDIRLLYGFREISPDAFGMPILQWWTVWNLLPVLYDSFHNSSHSLDIDPAQVTECISWIEEFLIETVEVNPESVQLLPASYVKGLPNTAIGQSSYSTAMALLICNCLELFDRQSISKQDLSKVRDQLLKKILNSGVLLATHYPILPYSQKVPDMEGYFTWIAILLAFKSMGFTLSKSDIDWATSDQVNDSVDGVQLEPNLISEVQKADRYIQDVWSKSAFTYDEKLYIKLKKYG
jgi:hypothetical protein